MAEAREREVGCSHQRAVPGCLAKHRRAGGGGRLLVGIEVDGDRRRGELHGAGMNQISGDDQLLPFALDQITGVAQRMAVAGQAQEIVCRLAETGLDLVVGVDRLDYSRT